MTESCLVVGLGQIGMGYDLALDPARAVFSHARALTVHPGFELLGGVDPSATQRALFERHYAQAAHPDVESALQSDKPDIVVIASPTEHHADLVKRVLSHSTPKAILCEKPLAYDPAEAQEMVAACEKAGVQLFVNYMRRADPGAIEVKNRIEDGAICAPIKGVAWYSKGFLHNGSHFFNLLEFWLGACVTSRMLDIGRCRDDRDPEPDVQVEFERGKVVFLAAWEEAFSHYTIELLSPSGRLRYEQGGEHIAWQSTAPDPNFPDHKTLQAETETIANGMSRYQWHVADQLADALAGKQHYLCTGRQALATLEAMHQIIRQR